MIVSCLPSFRVLFSSRSSSSYKNHTPSSGSRLSRLSRTPKGALRLENYGSSAGKGQADFSNLGTALGSEGISRLTASRPHTGYTAGAEGLNRLDSRLRDRDSGDSLEAILPIMPENGTVHVRNDIVSVLLYGSETLNLQSLSSI